MKKMTFEEFLQEQNIEEQFPSQQPQQNPQDANQLRYSQRSIGALSGKEDFFLNQLQQKSVGMTPEQRYKILGDVIMTLFPEPQERSLWINKLRADNMRVS